MQCLTTRALVCASLALVAACATPEPPHYPSLEPVTEDQSNATVFCRMHDGPPRNCFGHVRFAKLRGRVVMLSPACSQVTVYDYAIPVSPDGTRRAVIFTDPPPNAEVPAAEPEVAMCLQFPGFFWDETLGSTVERTYFDDPYPRDADKQSVTWQVKPDKPEAAAGTSETK